MSKVLKGLMLGVICFGIGGCYEPIANRSLENERERPVYSESQTPDNRPTENAMDQIGNEKTGGDPANRGFEPVTGGFRANVQASLKRFGLGLDSVVDEKSKVEQRIFAEYGAVLVSQATPPSQMMFTSDSLVLQFQERAGVKAETVGGVRIELQPEAMAALLKAIAAAEESGLKITPRDGEEAGRRSYSKTLDLWNSRFLKACDHWQKKGRLTSGQVSDLKSLPIKEQVNKVLEYEEEGIYFNTFFNNSILYSVAAPGTSQHLSMLALDVAEFANPGVRAVLADQGWYRTVQNDEPHFTFLGIAEDRLPEYGLKKVTRNGGDYWIPSF